MNDDRKQGKGGEKETGSFVPVCVYIVHFELCVDHVGILGFTRTRQIKSGGFLFFLFSLFFFSQLTQYTGNKIKVFAHAETSSL